MVAVVAILVAVVVAVLEVACRRVLRYSHSSLVLAAVSLTPPLSPRGRAGPRLSVSNPLWMLFVYFLAHAALLSVLGSAAGRDG